MVILMVSAFLIAWLPYATFAMYNALNPDAQVGVFLFSLHFISQCFEVLVLLSCIVLRE